MTNKYPRGSEWRKWDLHFHTPSSYDYSDKSVTNKDIIRVLKENHVEAVAITDHNTIDINRFNSLKNEAGDDIVFFPGIELCTDSRGNDPIHIIAIFPEDYDISYIWGELQVKLNISKQIKEGKKNNELYCNLSEASKEIRALGGIVFIHAGRKSNSLEVITNSLPVKMAEKEDIAKHVDVFELGQEKDAEDYLKIVFPKIKKTYPLIMCSDNHNINKYFVKQNLWIKADTTFEGLKQIIFEPVDRVCIQELKPDEKEIYRVISEVQINDSNFSPSPIPINANLTVIIGSRSSGKTTLLNSIAKSIDPSGFEMRFSNSRLIREPPLSLVKWQDGTVVPSETVNKGITYIPQNYIINLAEATGGQAPILEIAEKAIFDSEDSISTQKVQLDGQIETIGISLASEIFRLFTIKNQIVIQREKLKQIGDKAGINEQIKLLDKVIKSLQKNFTSEERDALSSLIKQYSENKSKTDILLADIELINAETSQPPTIVDIFQDRNISFKSAHLIEELTKFKEESRTIYLTKYLEFLRTEKDQLNSEKVILEKANADLLNVNKDLIAKSKENKSAQDKIKEKQDQETKLAEIVKEEVNLEKLETQFVEIRDIIIQAQNQRTQLRNDFITLASGTVDDIEYKAVLEIDKSKFNKYLIDSINFHNSVNCRDELNAIPGYKNGDNYEDTALIKGENIKIFLDLILNDKLKTKAGVSIQDAIEGLFADFEFINYSLLYEGDTYSQMTPGKKSLVVLKLLIESSKDKFPILIDQPEDDLDSRSISKEIVNFLRQKKKERQIILVTHNANIAIRADAEEIVVVNRHGTESKNANGTMFDYLTGAIEYSYTTDVLKENILDRMGTREHACDLLEGGKEAFENRRNKFNIKQII